MNSVISRGAHPSQWKKDGEGAAHYEFNFAMKKEFDSLYVSGENHIDNWCKLCHILSTTSSNHRQRMAVR